MSWQIRLEPGIYLTSFNDPRRARNQRKVASNSKICVIAIPNSKELRSGAWTRKVRWRFTQPNCNYKSFSHTFSSDSPRRTISDWFSYKDPQQMVANDLNEFLNISIVVEHLPNFEPGDRQAFKGLVNEGTTCYMNSLIQSQFFIRSFRNAIYKMPTLPIE